MTAPKGRLFQLALDCKKYVPKKGQKKKTVRVSGKHYDEGNAISLSYNVDVYSQSVYDSYRHNEPSAQLSFVDDMQGDTFYVEPFENETIPASYEEVNDDNPMLDKVVRPSEAEEEPQETDERREEAAENKNEESPVSSAPSPQRKPEKPVQTVAGEPEREDKDKETDEDSNAKYAVDDDEFANDIKAILQGEKVFDPEKKQTVSKGESPSKELLKQGGSHPQQGSSKPPKAEAELDPSANEHKIFEKIAQSMRYANSYDLGSIAMEKKFDQMENELAEEEIKTITSKKPVEEAKVVSEGPETTTSQESNSAKYNTEQPLSPENGGVEIGETQLKSGDLLLITSAAQGTAEKVCKAGIYLGDGKMVWAGEAGKIERANTGQALSGKSGVALRHRNAEVDAIQALTGKFDSDSDISNAQSPALEVDYAPVQIHRSVCDRLPKEDQEKCRQFKGKIDISTGSNDKFIIPYALIKALEASGLSILDKSIEGVSADTPVKTNHNGQWQYAGHLIKN